MHDNILVQNETLVCTQSVWRLRLVLLWESIKALQGVVQGNGAASPMFVAISSIMLVYLESNTVGVSVLSELCDERINDNN